MNISLNNVKLFSNESFISFKDELAASLTIRQKKFFLVVFGALSLLTAGYIIKQIFFKAKVLDISDDQIKKLPKELADNIYSKLNNQYNDAICNEPGLTSHSKSLLDPIESNKWLQVDMSIGKQKKEITAEVTVPSENEQVLHAVAAYFKKQGHLFKNIEINGKKLKI